MTVETILTLEEKDILQEIMNIAFGSAAADLAEVIDIYVVLNVPEIEVIFGNDLPEHLQRHIKQGCEAGMVIQKFWGDFTGSGVLLFPEGDQRRLITILDDGERDDTISDVSIPALENEVLLEVGNILIGACIGKIADLLSTVVTYSPPMIVDTGPDECEYVGDWFEPDNAAIILKTVFQFESQNVSGFLMIITGFDSVAWLRKALAEFMDSF